MTFEGTRAAGAALGSAVVMPFDDTVDLREILLRIASFFRDESCGQCVPCRVGTVRQEEILQRLAAGKPLASRAAEVVLLKEVGQAMRDASICGLGQTASSAIESALSRVSGLRAWRCRADEHAKRARPQIPVPPRPAAHIATTASGAPGRDHDRRQTRLGCRKALRFSMRHAASASTLPRSVSWKILPRSTFAASAWWKSRDRARWFRRARAWSKPGMVVKTDSERVRLSRRLVLELLAPRSTSPPRPSFRNTCGAMALGRSDLENRHRRRQRVSAILRRRAIIIAGNRRRHRLPAGED